jgi:mannosyltransferase OCH1-like enzyme
MYSSNSRNIFVKNTAISNQDICHSISYSPKKPHIKSSDRLPFNNSSPIELDSQHDKNLSLIDVLHKIDTDDLNSLDYQDSNHHDSNYHESNYNDSNHHDSNHHDSNHHDSNHHDSNYHESNYNDSNHHNSNHHESNYQLTDSDNENFTSNNISSIYNNTNYNADITIPKILIQTWKTKEIPEQWLKGQESIHSILHDWEHCLLDHKECHDFVAQHFPDFLPYYERFPYDIQRVDSFRACWLYVHGGVYMDLDFVVLRKLDSLFTSNCDLYLTHSSNIGSYYTNSFMASKPGCKFWLTYIEEMKKPLAFWAKTRHFIVMSTTGSLSITRAVEKWSGVIGQLPKKLILPCSVCNVKCKYEPDCYLKPLNGCSWISYDTKFLNTCMCNWREIVVAIFLILLVIVFYAIWCWFMY